jgi:tetratricopeptide (TPR) repeat protein
MRSIGIIFFAAVSFGCATAPQLVQSNSATSNSPANERSQTVIAHSSENQPAPAITSGEKTKWTQGGEPIDTKSYDDAIKAAEKGTAKAQSDAYYNRAVALTEARQYASALGDYRKAAKLDPSNTQAKDWIDKIIMIYDSMNKESPKEGEEPPALPFNK